MSVLRWFARSFAQRALFGGASRKASIRRRPARPGVTLLEDRLAPATLTVNSLVDGPVSASSSALTLRDAVVLIDSGGTATDASGRSLSAAKASQINTTSPFGSDDVIQFAASLFGSTPQQIVLVDGDLVLDRSATITGPAAGLLAINGNNQGAVFEVVAASVSISSLTIEDGAAGTAGGGGIINNGTLRLINTTVSGNTAVQGNGGGIVNNGTLALIDSSVSGNEALNDAGIDNQGTLTLTDSTVSGNTAVAVNGGLANYGGTMTLIDSTVSGNTARGAGGIGNYDNGTTILDNSSVSGNTASVLGGGIFNTANVTLIDSTVSDNAASGTGGGVINSGTMTLTGSSVSDNTAAGAGGIANYSTLTLTESSLSGNTAVVVNGGLANYGGTMTLVDSTVSGNTARGAGGIGNYDNGTTILDNSSVSGNTASVLGGGIFNTANVTLIDSTVSDNAASGTGGGIINSGTMALADSTVSDNTAAGAGGIANYSTLTLTESTVSGNTAIQRNGGIGNYGGTMALSDSSDSGNTEIASRDSIKTATQPLTSGTIPDDSTSSSVADSLAVNNASMLSAGGQTVSDSVFSGDWIRSQSSSGETDARTLDGSSQALAAADGAVNTGAMLLSESAVSGTATAPSSNDGSPGAGDSLTPVEGPASGTITSSGETSVQAPVDSNQLADGLTSSGALTLADNAVSAHPARDAQEGMTPVSGRGEQEVSLSSSAHPGVERVAAVASAVSNTENDRPESFRPLSGDNAVDQQPGFRSELTKANAAALLMLFPWLPDHDHPVEERPAESEGLSKRNKNRL
jgi:hypothetical protein